ncbi:MAG: TlpA family protein disulfide reductase [Caldilinea sp.]|nr:TlpA family protein disulfide reductase [Caldilinea sp.]
MKEAVTIDALMAELARQSPTNAAKIVEQLINTEVVLQRADGAATQQEIIAALEGLLATHSRTFDDLAAALATNDIPQERFDRYFSRLVSANAYLYSQQAATGVAAPVLLRSWQQETRISFGSIAASLFDAVQTPTTSSEIAAAPDKGTLAQPPIEPTAESIADSITNSIVDAPAEPFDLEPDEPRGVETGQIAPDFALPELSKDFATKNLHNFRGSPSVLSFWTTWCPYCLRQTPTLVEAHRQWGEQGIQFVGVNVKEDPSVVEPYVQQHGIEYPILLDADGAVASAYAVQGYPTTYFLDKNNRIVARHVGALTKEQLQNYLLALRPAE